MAEASPDVWPCTKGDYVLQTEIGTGAFAKVFRANCPSKNADVAVKIMAFEHIATSVEDILSEVQAMRACQHPNVLGIHCSFVVDSNLWVVMPLMNKGSCFRLLRNLRSKKIVSETKGLKEEWIAFVMRQTIRGLEYMHNKNIIHRDIKAGNILLNDKAEVRIADFGVAGWLTQFGRRADTRGTFVGTPCWMAPEVMDQHAGYNEKADIWSLGITALELARGYAPYAKMQPMQVLIKTLREDPPSLRSYPDYAELGMSKTFEAFVNDCLKKDPLKRPSAKALLNHKFVKNADKFRPAVQSEVLDKADPVDRGSSDLARHTGAGQVACDILQDGSIVQDLGEGSFLVHPADPTKKAYEVSAEDLPKIRKTAPQQVAEFFDMTLGESGLAKIVNETRQREEDDDEPDMDAFNTMDAGPGAVTASVRVNGGGEGGGGAAAGGGGGDDASANG